MPLWLLDSWELAFRLPAGRPDADRVARTLNTRAVRRAVLAAVRAIVRGRPALAGVRIALDPPGPFGGRS